MSSNRPYIYLKYRSKSTTIAEVLNQREYVLINEFNLGNYLIIIVIILLLTSLLFYLYVKIGIIEQSKTQKFLIKAEILIQIWK